MTGTIRYLIDEDGTVFVHADLGDPAAEVAALAESAAGISTEAPAIAPTRAVVWRRDPLARRMQAALRCVLSRSPGATGRPAPHVLSEVELVPDAARVRAGLAVLLEGSD